LENFESILDYGCGSGRLTRWFADAADSSVRVHGTDINPDAIAWCRQHLPLATFDCNGPEPPLRYPSESFDLILGVSVLTHLDEQLQLAWLAELARVSRPGGVVLLSIHAEDKARKDLPGGDFLPGSEFQKYLATGHYYQRANQLETVEGLPDFYQV